MSACERFPGEDARRGWDAVIRWANFKKSLGKRPRPRVQFPPSRRKTGFGGTPNRTRETPRDAYAPPNSNGTRTRDECGSA